MRGDDVLYDQYGFDSAGFNKDGYDIYGFDKNGLNKMVAICMVIKKDQVKLKLAKQYLLKIKKEKDVNLPISLSKIYTNNSSKELINNIKLLINDLYDTKQITKQVYNNSI